MERNPKKRLGCGAKDAEEIKKQPFFKDVEWDKLDKKLLEPPFRPALVLTSSSSAPSSSPRYFMHHQLKHFIIVNVQ